MSGRTAPGAGGQSLRTKADKRQRRWTVEQFRVEGQARLRPKAQPDMAVSQLLTGAAGPGVHGRSRAAAVRSRWSPELRPCPPSRGRVQPPLSSGENFCVLFFF